MAMTPRIASRSRQHAAGMQHATCNIPRIASRQPRSSRIRLSSSSRCTSILYLKVYTQFSLPSDLTLRKKALTAATRQRLAAERVHCCAALSSMKGFGCLALHCCRSELGTSAHMHKRSEEAAHDPPPAEVQQQLQLRSRTCGVWTVIASTQTSAAMPRSFSAA